MKRCTAIWKSWRKHISFIAVLDTTCAEGDSENAGEVLSCRYRFALQRAGLHTRQRRVQSGKCDVSGTLQTRIYRDDWKTPDGEVDFVAQKQNDRLYVQVTREIKSEKTEKREYERLLEIRDNYPKYVLRTDEFAGGNYQGIKSMYIADFLLSAEY